MEIRRLGPEDAAIWRDIRLEALARAPEQFSARHDEWAGRALADFAQELAAMSVWAAIAGGRAQGVAALARDANSGAHGWIEAVYVREVARGRGVAKAIIAKAEHEARTRGYEKLCLEVRAANVEARGLYAQLGFSESSGEKNRSCASRCEVTMAKAL